MTTETLTPYEATLQQKKAALEAEITDLQAQKVAAQRVAADRLTAIPAGVDSELARKSALEPLVEIDQHIEVLRLALSDLAEVMAQAPALLQQYKHEVKALGIARGRVDRASAKAVAALENFLAANDALLGEYRQAKLLSRGAWKLWQDLDRPGDAPGLPKYQWPMSLHQRVRAAPMVRIELVGDRSIGG